MMAPAFSPTASSAVTFCGRPSAAGPYAASASALRRASAGALLPAFPPITVTARRPRRSCLLGGLRVGVAAAPAAAGPTMMGGRRKGRGTRVPPITPPGGSGRKADDGEGRAPKGGGGGGTGGGGGGAGLAPLAVSGLTPLSKTGEPGRLPSPLPPPSSGSSLAATSRPTAPSEKAARSIRTGSLRRRPLDGKWDRVSVTLGGRAGGGRRGRSSLKAKAAVQAVATPLVAERGAEHSTELVFSGESNLAPDSCPALVLNADYQPLSYLPLSLWPWQEVIKAVYQDRVQVVAVYPNASVRSPGRRFELPSVIALREYRPIAGGKPAFTRFNVFLRDDFTCQYCDKRFPVPDLTFDHVMPRCQGGAKTCWTNIVAACVSCNHRKGGRTLAQLSGEMKLRRKPVEPTNAQLQVVARRFPPRWCHETWRDYLYWDTELID